MSDLQIALALLGSLIVAAVVAFNWWQERQFRRRGEEAFPASHDDVLLDQPAAAASVAPRAALDGGRGAADRIESASIEPGRIEPSLEPRLEPVLDARGAPAAGGGFSGYAAGADMPREEIDYVVEIRAGDFIRVGDLSGLQQALPSLQRRLTFAGLNHHTRAWESLAADDSRYTAVRVGLQLVDRGGPVTDTQLREFGDAARQAAGDMSAIAELPEYSVALGKARELDDFCADVDVVVGINVIAATGEIFQGTKIRALAEAAGLHLQSSGVFQSLDDHGRVMFSLDNQESEPFAIDRIRSLATPGITFLFDVPRVANGMKTFDRMVALSRSFADSLGGSLADDNRALLNDHGIDQIRGQLRAIYGSMEQRGIEAGGALALRLFS